MVDIDQVNIPWTYNFGNKNIYQMTRSKSYPNEQLQIIPPLVLEVEPQSGLGSLLLKAESAERKTHVSKSKV